MTTKEILLSLPADYPDKASALARSFYADKEFNCAEAAFTALLEAAGIPCPPDMTRFASAFGKGMGSGCTCGSLAGSQMAVGMFFGRTEPSGKAPLICIKTAKALHDRFKEQNKVTCCRILCKGLKHGSPEQKAACAQRTAETVKMAAQVILEMRAQA